MIFILQVGCGKNGMVLYGHEEHNTGVHSRVGQSIGGELVSTSVDVNLRYLSSTILEPQRPMQPLMVPQRRWHDGTRLLLAGNMPH